MNTIPFPKTPNHCEAASGNSELTGPLTPASLTAPANPPSFADATEGRQSAIRNPKSAIPDRSLPKGLYHGRIGGGVEIKAAFGQNGVEDDVGEVVPHAGAVGESHFGGGEGEIVGADADVHFAHQAAGERAPGLQRDLPVGVGLYDGEDAELGFHDGAAFGKAGVQEGQHVAPLPRLGAGERVFLNALESRVDDEQGVGLAQGDGLGGLADFPAEAVGHGNPYLAGGNQWLGEDLQRAGLNDLRGEGVEVGLGGEPRVKHIVSFGGAAASHRAEEEDNNAG